MILINFFHIFKSSFVSEYNGGKAIQIYPSFQKIQVKFLFYHHIFNYIILIFSPKHFDCMLNFICIWLQNGLQQTVLYKSRKIILNIERH